MAKSVNESNLNVQPQAIEAEQAVLGAMLSSKEAVSKVIGILQGDHFYRDSHAKIYITMTTLFHENVPIDTISLIDLLKKNKELEEVGGAYFITGLMESVPTVANVEEYARIVLEKALLRKLINISHEIAKEAFSDAESIEDILDRAESQIFSISENRLKGGFKHIDPILAETFEQMDAISSKGGGVIGVPSGLKDLDTKTAGFHPSDLVIIAGRPGMGKTALALTIARNAAVDHNEGIGIFSLEMSNNQLAMRMLCSEARVDNHLVRTGMLPKEQWKQLSFNAGKLSEAPIYLDDSPGITVLELRAKARRLKAEHDIKMIVVDYLQLMQGPKGVESRQQEISVISRSLKALAKDLNIPIIALSQLSRAVESRTDRRPQLSDLRESGAIEQDADVVMFLYRHWFYNKEDEDTRAKAEIILAKQRNGPTGTVPVTFLDRFTRFEDASDMEDFGNMPPF